MNYIDIVLNICIVVLCVIGVLLYTLIDLVASVDYTEIELSHFMSC